MQIKKNVATLIPNEPWKKLIEETGQRIRLTMSFSNRIGYSPSSADVRVVLIPFRSLISALVLSNVIHMFLQLFIRVPSFLAIINALNSLWTWSTDIQEILTGRGSELCWSEDKLPTLVIISFVKSDFKEPNYLKQDQRLWCFSFLPFCLQTRANTYQIYRHSLSTRQTEQCFQFRKKYSQL